MVVTCQGVSVRRVIYQDPETRIIHLAVERLTQRTLKFIRWLKNHLDLERDRGQAIARLNEVCAHF